MTLFSLIDGIAEVSLQTHRNTADIAQLIMWFFDVLTVKFIQCDTGCGERIKDILMIGETL